VRTVRDPRDAGVERCTLDDLRGGDAAHNAARLREALAGRDTAAHRDALALNAALALEVTGTEPDAASAVAHARQALASGAGSRLLDRIAAFAKDYRQ
jgi:anthranilate phosphoribosyltransferase